MGVGCGSALDASQRLPAIAKAGREALAFATAAVNPGFEVRQECLIVTGPGSILTPKSLMGIRPSLPAARNPDSR